MNLVILFQVLGLGLVLISLQILFATRHGYFSQWQRKRGGKYAYTLTQHGGFWVDTLFLTWVIAYVASANDISYLSLMSLCYLLVAIAVWALQHRVFARNSVKHPEPMLSVGE